MSKEESQAKRKEYLKWYYQTYLKKRREAGIAKVTKYQRKTEEEKAENFKRAAEKRRKTMLERYGEEGVKKIYSDNGKKLNQIMAERGDDRYRPTSEKAREMQLASAAARHEKKVKRQRKKVQNDGV